MGEFWRNRDADQLWLKVISQIVVAGNAAPGCVVESSQVIKRQLAFSRLKLMRPAARRVVLHRVLRAIGTRYVGKSATRSKKISAALHNFRALDQAGGPKRFFGNIAALESTAEKIELLQEKFQYYKSKGARDTLIDLQLAENCMALDRRIGQILKQVGAHVPDPIDREYERIERELIEGVAKPCRVSGGELDRILFQNYGEIMVRLACAKNSICFFFALW
jgi:hypothetical protein